MGGLAVGLVLGLLLAIIKVGFGWVQNYVPHQTIRKIWKYAGLLVLALIAVASLSPPGEFQVNSAFAALAAFVLWFVLLVGLATNQVTPKSRTK